MHHDDQALPELAGNAGGAELVEFDQAELEPGAGPSPAYFLYMARLAAGSRPAMRAALDRCARYLTDRPGHRVLSSSEYPWHEIRSAHAHIVRARLQAAVDGEDSAGEVIKPTTANRVLAALRGVAKVCFGERWISGEDYAQVKHMPSIRGEALGPLAGRMLADGEVAALFSAAARRRRAPGGSNALDCALLAVLYGGGLRRAEVCRLDLGDYDGERLIVHGKGHKERLVPLPDGARHHLDRWLELRGLEAGPLLCWVKGGVDPTRRLTVSAIDKRLRRLAKSVDGIDPFTAHDFRRTFASTMLERGADVSTVQRLMGHSDPKTTTQYDRRDEGAKRKAVNLLFVPFD